MPAQSPLERETASYRVTYGIFGQVAEATVSLAPDAHAAASLLRAVGTGSGAVLGFGKSDSRIESEFDPRELTARRWTHTRTSDGKTTADTGEQPSAGAVSLLRKRTGQPDQTETLNRAAQVLDPLSLLLKLRMALPDVPGSYEMLDGRALWRVDVAAARTDPSETGLVRLDGKLSPIDWNGNPDESRSSRSFAVFFSRDRYHTPVRMIVPLGLGQIRVELVRVDRPDERWRNAVAASIFCRLCRRCPPCPNAIHLPTSAFGGERK